MTISSVRISMHHLACPLAFSLYVAGDHRAAFSIVLVGNQIAESVLTMSLGVKSQRRSEHPDLFGSQSVRMGRLSLSGPG
jgi:hypothetical protein